jgi:hypothetical protein
LLLQGIETEVARVALLVMPKKISKRLKDPNKIAAAVVSASLSDPQKVPLPKTPNRKPRS